MVREFTRDDDWRVTIAFDARVEKESASAPEFAEKFERGVTLAASLISHFIRAGVETRLITVLAPDSTTGGSDSGFGVGNAHSYKMFYQLARIAPATEADVGRDPSPARSDDPFLIVIASASRAPHLNGRAAEFIALEEYSFRPPPHMMNLERYFIFSSYAMFMTGYVMLASTRQLDVFSLGLFAVVLGAGWLINSGRLSWSVGHRSANWLMAGGLVFLIAEWYALGVSPVTVTLHFVFFTAALKLLRRKSSRDWIWLYVVTFCQVLMTAGMMVSTTFLLLVIVYLFAATSAFIAYEMRRSASAFAANNPSRRVTVEYRKESDRRPVEEPRLGSLPVFSACALAAILLLAAPIFLAMPRVSRGFSRSGMLRGEALSGFSDSVRLGEVAQVKLNPQVVMRVRVKFLRGAGPSTLRWRGVTLDNYDGQTWNYTGQKPATLKRGVDGFHLGERRLQTSRAIANVEKWR